MAVQAIHRVRARRRNERDFVVICCRSYTVAVLWCDVSTTERQPLLKHPY
ncbi:MAG: hypothetical protein AVDCRST_MAG77-5144 [uncultured Chloroflexi bacterium]|uniref:Uncharacterized protein n=1 Tax=uncultured Chloroflexota bacterium TaxID=166587 RepID=A0A6J4K500_9CHLR|nr:MAG: hypothetical protein AVDCRST_MAG77-5144 [uncultured Chloroflexota bacterium]